MTHRERLEEIEKEYHGSPVDAEYFVPPEDDFAYLLTRVKKLTAALEFYAHEIKWNPHVCDSYSGEQYAPDWSGELGIDEPWEPARKALAFDESNESEGE